MARRCVCFVGMNNGILTQFDSEFAMRMRMQAEVWVGVKRLKMKVEKKINYLNFFIFYFNYFICLFLYCKVVII